MVIPIERATEGKVSRSELRPDLYPLEPNTSPQAGMPEAESAQATGRSPGSQPLPNVEAAGREAA